MAERIFTQTFGVVGAILEKGGKFLLVQEKNKGHFDNGKWNQPAGWIDVGENPVDAVKREVLEETGLIFEPSALLGVYSLFRKDFQDKSGCHPHAIKLIFKGKITGGKQLESNEEIGAIKWYSRQEIEAMDKNTLRDLDIKTEVADFLNGKSFSLDIINHTISQ